MPQNEKLNKKYLFFKRLNQLVLLIVHRIMSKVGLLLICETLFETIWQV